MLQADRDKLGIGCPLDLEDLLAVFLSIYEMDALARLVLALGIVFLGQVEEMHLVVVTHVSCGKVLAIWAHGEGRDGAATLGHSHHLKTLGSDSVPDKDHRLETNLARGNSATVSAHAKSNYVVAVPKLTLSLLLALLDTLLATSEDLLHPRVSVKYNAQCGCHVDALLILIVVEVLARKITFVTVHKVDLKDFVRHRFVNRWHNIRCLNRANPRLACHELVADLRLFNEELVIAGQLIRLLIFVLLGWVAATGCCAILNHVLKLVLILGPLLVVLHVLHELPLLVIVGWLRRRRHLRSRIAVGAWNFLHRLRISIHRPNADSGERGIFLSVFPQLLVEVF